MSQILTDGNNTVTASQSVVYALDGFDSIDTQLINTIVYLGEGDDIVLSYTEPSSPGTLTAHGDGGRDTLAGGPAGDNLYGGVGTDLLVGGRYDFDAADNGNIVPGEYFQAAYVSGSDSLHGDDDSDSIWGFDGDDFLFGGNGDDSITVIVESRDDFNALGYYRINGGLFGGAGNDFLDGGRGNDTLDGGADSDILLGGEGNDDLFGGLGSDRMDGGFGFDYARFEGSTAGVTVRLDGAVGVGGEAAGDTFANIEGLVGSNLSDALVGSAVNNTLFGLVGDDALYGVDGDDTLSGGDGFDQLNGGPGADRLDGGAGFDFARFDFATRGMTARLDGGAGVGEGAGDSFVSIEGFVGSEFSDLLVGNGETNTIFGQGGVDDIYGGAGTDSLDGGTGDDSLTGGAGSDVLNGNVGSDRFRFALADLAVGDRDIIKDFGESGINFDFLLLPSGVGISSADTAGGALITFQIAGGTAGVLLQGFTVAQLADQYFII